MAKNARGKNYLWTIVLSTVLYQTAAAQENPAKSQEREPIDAKTITRVALGPNTGNPGSSVAVPIYFVPAERVEVGSLKLEVNFVSINMKFTKLDPGIAAETGKITLASDVKLGKNDKDLETSTVTVLVSLPSGQPAKKGFATGLLGYINLKISKTARTAKITLRATAEGTELGSGKPLKNVQAFDAQVEVLAPGTLPAPACFFFSH